MRLLHERDREARMVFDLTKAGQVAPYTPDKALMDMYS
jgi:hypothetical protein